MLSQMYQINQAGRAIIFMLTKNNHVALKVKGRSMTITSFKGLGESLTYTNSTVLPDSAQIGEKENVPQSNQSRLDNKVSMALMRKNFHPPGLKVARNRDNLVLDFYYLTKSIAENRLTVEEFVASQTFEQLQEQVELNIDIMNNAQIVNLLASVIKMRINPSTNLVKLLEHEVKFRLKSFNLNQTIKMLKFYNSIEISSEQKQLADMLSYRIRAHINNDANTVKDLNSILHLTGSQQAQNSLLSLIEERLLNLLTIKEVDDDNLISKYLPTPQVFDYNSLCDLFVKLAENKRRPTPLLRAASIELCKISITNKKIESPKAETIISALNALVSLSYPNRTLISKLMSDLAEIIKLDELDSNTICNLLRSISNLRWRPDGLLKMLFSHVKEHSNDYKRVDHRVIVALLHVAALVNYRPNEDMKQFYGQCIKGDREQLLDRHSRKWLNYVWSLVVLDIADESHIRSVLSDEFYQSVENSPSDTKLVYSDIMKLLNLQAIAYYELRLDGLNCKKLDNLIDYKIQRSADMQKFSSKVRDALNGIVNSPNELSHEIQTPFGFIVDCELMLNENLEPLPLDETNSLKEIILSANNGTMTSPNCRKCALIYLSFDDTIASTQGEAVGHKQMISRILKTIRYETVFLPEILLNREKNSADLSNKIKEIIKTSLSCNTQN